MIITILSDGELWIQSSVCCLTDGSRSRGITAEEDESDICCPWRGAPCLDAAQTAVLEHAQTLICTSLTQGRLLPLCVLGNCVLYG